MDMTGIAAQMSRAVAQNIQPTLRVAVSQGVTGQDVVSNTPAPVDFTQSYFIVGVSTIHDTDTWTLG